MRRTLVLSLLACALGAQEITVFREPDKKTRKEIENDLISGRGIGEGNLNARRRARARLIEIGGWSVPFLERAVAGPKAAKNPLVRANAVFAATRIGDAAITDDLLAVLKKDRNDDVVRIATLALGWLGAEPTGSKDRRAVVLARAKLGERPGLDEGGRLPRGLDQHTAAAYLLAEAIAWHQPSAALHLTHDKPLLRRAAATALRLRPDGQHEAALLKAIAAEKRPDVKALQVHALGALPRTNEVVWEKLVRSLRDDEREVQVAAALELAGRPGRRDDYDDIRRAYRAARPAAAAAMMGALLATGHPDAIDDLLNVGSKQQFFGAGALLRHLAFGEGEPRYQEIATKVAKWRDLDPLLKGLADVVRYSEKKPDARRREAADTFARLPRGAAIWRTPDERTWAMVDDLLLRLFELDALSDFANLDSKMRESDTPITGDDAPAGREKRAIAVTPDEQDLADFLKPGYFRAGDLHREH